MQHRFLLLVVTPFIIIFVNWFIYVYLLTSWLWARSSSLVELYLIHYGMPCLPKRCGHVWVALQFHNFVSHADLFPSVTLRCSFPLLLLPLPPPRIFYTKVRLQAWVKTAVCPTKNYIHVLLRAIKHLCCCCCLLSSLKIAVKFQSYERLINQKIEWLNRNNNIILIVISIAAEYFRDTNTLVSQGVHNSKIPLWSILLRLTAYLVVVSFLLSISSFSVSHILFF